MRLVTIQWKGVLDILKEQGVYRAQYGYGFREYIAQYQQLAKLCNFSSCPIFCAPINDESSLYGIKEDDDHIRIELDIPDSRVIEMDYYDWSDYLYYSSGCDYDDYYGFDAEEALVNIDKYIKLGNTSREQQFVIEEIYEKDIVNKEILER